MPLVRRRSEKKIVDERMKKGKPGLRCGGFGAEISSGNRGKKCGSSGFGGLLRPVNLNHVTIGFQTPRFLRSQWPRPTGLQESGATLPCGQRSALTGDGKHERGGAFPEPSTGQWASIRPSRRIKSLFQQCKSDTVVPIAGIGEEKPKKGKTRAQRKSQKVRASSGCGH